ncbi:MAG: pyridoxal 5'-phosphate synthase glutaminase subunit PdxT [Chloroflexi bacterium]|nr:pyridoxal 5'-phosphate synthase glutaminase subunit PdxT [Chloroflexota bacterium]MQG00186.1 pyridoxal 5'-phosphate synthase glutaminase subunit PdxT [SAR202 cluster bacterium]
MTRIGVLALQGDFAEHIKMLSSLGVDSSEIRLPSHLDSVDGLIIPGGESTTIVQLMDNFGLTEQIKDLIFSGLPVWGTCAGMIVLAADITDDRPKPMGIIDITVSRNAYGRQVDSFEAVVDIPKLGETPFNAIFIRAPAINSIGDSVEILATLDEGQIIAAQEGNVIVTSFHPELTDDLRFHKYFASVVADNNFRNN